MYFSVMKIVTLHKTMKLNMSGFHLRLAIKTLSCIDFNHKIVKTKCN